MSNRLKRKLGELGIDATSSKANESFCLIGTPLPSLAKSKDIGEFVPLWKQEVRDEKGRRRLHGAFTGGFSAGYFNTVGSKEGWTPSTFLSSRKDRAKTKTARPEDFMDEEDLQQLQEGRDLVNMTDDPDPAGEAQGRLGDDGDIDLDPLLQALQPIPINESPAARILKKMGWRPGQGIGPRLTLRQRQQQDLQARQAASTYKITESTINAEDNDAEAQKHTYARRDTPIMIVEPKETSHGLGYIPGMRLSESLGARWSEEGKSKGPQISAGFGLGALNDADEDDLDIYEVGTHRGRTRMAYDMISDRDDDSITIGSKSLQKKNLPGHTRSSSQVMFKNGTPVLDGFVLSDKPMVEMRRFPLPEVPDGWKPDPNRVWDADPNKVNPRDPSAKEATTYQEWKTKKMSATERGSVLGETPLPSAPRSVFDYISQKDRERLQLVAAGGLPVTPVSISIPRTEAHIAAAALKGFQPFPTNPQRQARYVEYLRSQAAQDGSVAPPPRLEGQTIENYNRELGDYAQSALVFKPVSGAMAGRFTSAAVIDFAPNIREGLHTPSDSEGAKPKEQETKKTEDPKIQAANLGMFGPLTRETKPWQPARLLCKRFGVREPAVFVSETHSTEPTDPSSSDPLLRPETITETITETIVQKRRDIENIGFGDDETQGQDILTYVRPPMDIFKAIFASDSENSDDEKEVEEEEERAQGPLPPVSMSAAAPANDGPVDISLFKPKFIPRDASSTHSSKKDKKKKKDKKDVKKHEKKSILVSFELEEDATERPRKLGRIDQKRDSGESNVTWTDKPTKDDVTHMPAIPTDPGSKEERTELGTQEASKGRKRAVDFL